jgi:hypothetical protein
MSSFMCKSCRKLCVANQTPSRLQRRQSLILQGEVDCCCLLDNFCPYIYSTDRHSAPRSFTHPYENYITTHFRFTSLTNKMLCDDCSRLLSIHDNLLTNWVVKTEDTWLGLASSLRLIPGVPGTQSVRRRWLLTLHLYPG